MPPNASSPPQPAYRGRFAPTPSGPLHLGSLLAALASFLQARTQGGAWLLRIDDLDRERCVPDSDSLILRQLEQHGLHWDEAPRYQSRHRDDYQAALQRLQAAGLVYACRCTRAELARAARPGPNGPVYAGTCRSLRLPPHGNALRLRVHDRRQHFDDGWQGPQSCALATEVGDFVLLRRDGIVGYQLSCAVDEAAQQITEVVRGVDLLGSTFMQLTLSQALVLPAPAYRHLPVLITADGRKLSKQNHATALVAAQAGNNLLHSLHGLGQQPPAVLRGAPAREVVDWALQHWDPRRVPARPSLQLEAPA